MDDLEVLFKQLFDTNVTKTIHQKAYPAISPSQPKLNQSGRAVLITGGGTGVGFGIAKSFVEAAAGTILIVARRADVLATAASSLEQHAKDSGTQTKIVTRTCDITNLAEVEALWKGFAAEGVNVDILVSNAAKFTEPKPLLELGADEVWSQFEVNIKSPLYFVEKFCAQKSEGQKFLLNVTSQVIHMFAHPGVAVRPAYSLTKMSATLFFQLLAQNTAASDVQVVSFHPGIVYSDAWKEMGVADEGFDNSDLAGAFAVWAATKEAAFLHGRFLWTAWDVEELATGELRKRIENDPYFLRASVVGLNSGLLA